MTAPRLTVVGIGGNAVSPPRREATFAEERAAVEGACRELASLAAERLLVVHGNGPQVGRLLSAPGLGDPDALDVHVAQSQGELGYLVAESLEARTSHPCVAVVTRVLVDRDDPGFDTPTKPIGPVLQSRPPDSGFAATPDGVGWRQVVASPRPRRVIERAAIAELLRSRHVVAGGGGGVAMIESRGLRNGVAAVIDKDWVAALLAIELGAERLIFVTDVAGAFERFGDDAPVALREMSVAKARTLLQRGTFAAGSMAPKVESAMEFAEATGRAAYIARLGEVADTLRGICGTTVHTTPS